MVNENTRMYVPEENHQGKRDPIAAPGSPALPTAGLCGAARAACARGANAARGSPREAAEPPCEPERKIPAPPPPRPGFFRACGSHEIPGKGGKFPKCLAFASKAGWPGRAAESWGAAASGSLALLGRGRERARVPRGDQPGAGGPYLGCPASTQTGATSSGSALQVAGGGGGGGCSCASQRASALHLSAPGLLNTAHLSTAIDPERAHAGRACYCSHCSVDSHLRMEVLGSPVMCGLCFFMFSGNHGRV